MCSVALVFTSVSHNHKHIWSYLKPKNCAIVTVDASISFALSKTKKAAREDYVNFDLYNEKRLKVKGILEPLTHQKLPV